MKKILLLLITSFFISGSWAQCEIPAAGFEDWGKLQLDSNKYIMVPMDTSKGEVWFPLFSLFGYYFGGAPVGVAPTSDAHTGDSAAMFFSDPNTSPKTSTGDLVTKFGCIEKKAALDGFYKLENAPTGDTICGIEVIGLKFNSTSMANDTVGSGFISFTQNTSSYEPFSFNIDWTDTPDTVMIWMLFFGDSTMAASLKIDDVSWGTGSTDITVEVNEEKSIDIFPNPANREISIVCHDVKWTNTKIFSANGLLVTERVKSCDSSIENIDVSNFKKGLYFIQIQTDKSEILVKKFLKE